MPRVTAMAVCYQTHVAMLCEANLPLSPPRFRPCFREHYSRVRYYTPVLAQARGSRCAPPGGACVVLTDQYTGRNISRRAKHLYSLIPASLTTCSRRPWLRLRTKSLRILRLDTNAHTGRGFTMVTLLEATWFVFMCSCLISLILTLHF